MAVPDLERRENSSERKGNKYSQSLCSFALDFGFFFLRGRGGLLDNLILVPLEDS